MTAPELSRAFDTRSLPHGPVTIVASAAECAALARRFALVRVASLEAELLLVPAEEAVEASGRLRAAMVQVCAISGEDLPVTIDEPLTLRFVPERDVAEEEIELEEPDLDEIAYHGTTIDVGEAVAQSLALAIDPYATGPEAERARQQGLLATPEAGGPFAALAALRKD